MYKFLLSFCLFSVACVPYNVTEPQKSDSNPKICSIAEKHLQKLRDHFKGKRTNDVSTLISETRAISNHLKQLSMHQKANKFDSYIDVLTYGNRTLDESLDDVMTLVVKKEKVCP